jgi:hypothetical protein
VVVIAIVSLGWWYLGRPEKYPGYQAPVGGYGQSGGAAPGMGVQRQGPGGGAPH